MENKTNIQSLNEREFAKVVGISYSLLKKLRQRGIVKGYCRVGRRVLYVSPDHVEAFFRLFEKAA
jgi:hypothetical protein